MCRCTRVLAHLTHAKLQKLTYTCTVAHDFGMCMQDNNTRRPFISYDIISYDIISYDIILYISFNRYTRDACH